MGWWIALGILVLLAILPLGVSVKYDAGGPLVRVIAGPIRFTVFPMKKKEKKPKKEKKKKKEEPAASVETVTEEKPKAKKDKKAKKKEANPDDDEPKGGSILDFLPLVKVGINFLGDFRRKLRVNVLELKLIMAGGDPCDLATNYGKAWAALGNLWPKLEKWFVIKKRDVEIECDFTASETLIIARLDITITLGRIIALAVCYAVRALAVFLRIRKKQKGGAVK